MDREIKFRAWDEFNKNMHYQNPSYRNSKSLYNFFNNVEGHEQGGNRMLLMQYTGLKDKNGKEIYEGDILADGWSDRIGVVEFSRGHFYINFAYPEFFSTQLEDAKIIGNKFENPELLEDK